MTASKRFRLVLDVHGIGPQPPWVMADEASYWCDDPKTFERILDSIPQVTIATGVPVEITFDDGNMSDSTIAVPALTKRNLTASFFVCAGRIGQPGYLDRLAMADMLAAGMKIGSHGWDHVDWRKIDSASLDREVNGAKRMIEDAISHPVESVAIPFGSYDRRVIKSLAPFTTIYTSDGGLAVADRIVPRTSYQKDWTDETVMDLAANRESSLAKMKRSLATAIKRLR